MTHESLNFWLIEVDKVLKQNKTWEREFRYKFRNLSIGTKKNSEINNRGEHS